MSFSAWLLCVLAGALLLATLLPYSRSESRWIRVWEFPRLQLAALGLGLGLLELEFLDLTEPLEAVAALSTGACVGVHAWWIAPFSWLHPPEVPRAADSAQGDRLRVMIANVEAGNRNAAGLVDQVSEWSPDVLVTLESDAWWERELDDRLPRYGFTIRCAQDNYYGMHVYSCLPLEETSIAYLVEPDVPSMHALVVLRSGRRVRAHFLHPTPPAPSGAGSSTARDAELVAVGRSLRDSQQPVVVTGDLNDVAWSATTRLFRKISGLLDPRVGRGLINSFHARHWFMRWPLDHLFHSSHFSLVDLRRLRAFGSDHYPVLVELRLDGAGPCGDAAGLAAESDDRRWARQKLAHEPVCPSDVPTPGEPTRCPPSRPS